MKNDKVYNEIYKIYYRNIYIFCYHQLHNEDSAKECTQETFLTLYKKMPYLNLSLDFGAWLHKTAINHIKEYRRKNPNNQIPLDDAENTLIYNFDYSDIKDLLTEEEYILVKEYYIQKKAVENLAEKYKITKSGIYTRLKKIRKKLSKACFETINVIK